MKTYKLPPTTKVASFDVDAQQTFTPLCPTELPVPEGHRIAGELNRQAARAAYRVGSKDAHSPHAIWVTTKPEEIGIAEVAGNDVDVRWPIHAVPGTQGFDLIPGLPPVTSYDFFVWKGVEVDMHPYGACYHDFAERLSTGVIEFLRAKGVTTVLVGGLATDYCVKTTALQLRRAGFEVVVNRAACRGINDTTVVAACAEMDLAGICFVADAAALEAA